MASKITETGESLTRVIQQGAAQLLPEVLRRALERGQEVSATALRLREQSIRELIPGANLTRDLTRLILAQVDETKKAVVRAVANEFKDFLEATDLATELQKALTSLSLELKTEVRFIANDRAVGGVRPSIEIKAARTTPAPRPVRGRGRGRRSTRSRG
jgi:hypothetical protein